MCVTAAAGVTVVVDLTAVFRAQPTGAMNAVLLSDIYFSDIVPDILVMSGGSSWAAVGIWDRQGGSGPTETVLYASSYATVAVAVGGPGGHGTIFEGAGQHHTVLIEDANQFGSGD